MTFVSPITETSLLRRVTAVTNMNAGSSRSHAVRTLVMLLEMNKMNIGVGEKTCKTLVNEQIELYTRLRV
jgi:hypothetical protein